MTTDKIYCAAQIYAQTLYFPAETCEIEVEQDGDYCERHDYTDEDAADDAREHAIEGRKGY